MVAACWGNTITKDQFYARYKYLEELEVDLSEKGKNLGETDSQELLALSNLVMKDRQIILRGKEKVTVPTGRYYYVLFENARLSELRTLIQGYLNISSLPQMIEAFETTDWYRTRILSHVTVDYNDTQRALHNFHENVMAIIKIFKARVEKASGQETFHTHGEFLINYVWKYSHQKDFTDQSTQHILRLLRHHDQLIDQPQDFVDAFSKLEEQVAEHLSGLGMNLQTQFRTIESIATDAFSRLNLELAFFTTVAPDPNKSNRSNYEIFEVNLIYLQLLEIKSIWKMRFNALARKSEHFEQFVVNANTEQDLLERSLSNLSFLHAACIQNELLTKKMQEYYDRERRYAPPVMIHRE